MHTVTIESINTWLALQIEGGKMQKINILYVT